MELAPCLCAAPPPFGAFGAFGALGAVIAQPDRAEPISAAVTATGLTPWLDDVEVAGPFKDSIKMPRQPGFVVRPAAAPPEWFATLYSDLAFAKSKLVTAAWEAGVEVPPPSPTRPAGDALLDHLQEASHLIATLRTLMQRLADAPLDLSPSAREAADRLAGHFIAAGRLREASANSLPQVLRIEAEWLAPLGEQLALALHPQADGPGGLPLETPEDSDPDSAVADLIAETGGALTLTEVAEQSGVSRQRIHQRLVAGQLFGLRARNGRYRLPLAQFLPRRQPLEALPGLDAVIALFSRFGADGAPLLAFLGREAEGLDGPPAEALARGELGGVLAAAARYLGLEEEAPPGALASEQGTG